MRSTTVQAVAVPNIPIVRDGDNLAELIMENIQLEDGDILVIASKVVSKSEGRLVKASEVTVSKRANEIAERNGFDPIHVEIALRESVEIVREEGVLITETKSGIVCNFSGVDKSNVSLEEYVLLPSDPDKSASSILDNLTNTTGLRVAVIISDTQGRPWRKGSINIAIGCAGISAFKYNHGKKDLHGRVLKRSTICQIDEITALVEPLMGQANESNPVVIVRGYEYTEGKDRASNISRTKEEDMFR
ncbi:MAG: coenzyme F420-0:L-glutamate ligase [Candidatus Thorarchaeota archaeon]|jgi:coenzyme F420-0:L-glutamate ligase/coenzyme F420-1:gamma-L-glutamate ligase